MLSIRKSLRFRLQAWYALVLTAVVAGFAGLLYAQISRSVWREVDNEIRGAADYLDGRLRGLPPHVLENFRRDPDPRSNEPPVRILPLRERDDETRRRGPPPPGGAQFSPDGRPRPIERFLDDLKLPDREPLFPGAPPREPIFFSIWTDDGRLIKRDEIKGGSPIAFGSPRMFTMPSTSPRHRVETGDFLNRPSAMGGYRTFQRRGPADTIIQVARSIEREQGLMRSWAWRLIGGAVGVLAVGLIGGWMISKRILDPINEISATAAGISASNLSKRIDTARVDTELVGLSTTLNETFGRLEQAFAQLTRFTADASHELRTPLTILQTHAELALARPREAADYRETIETCLRMGQRMSQLVDGLLTLARADAGKLELRAQPVELAPLVQETVGMFRPIAEEKKVILRANLQPAKIDGDPGRIAQVLTNLISNAIQYNHAGGAVDISLSQVDDAALLKVSDTGVGIPAADQPRVFERFFRVDAARARDSGGNGLGLAICKSIIEAHGGAIGFESSPGRGTTFWIRLPLANGPDAAG